MHEVESARAIVFSDKISSLVDGYLRVAIVVRCSWMGECAHRRWRSKTISQLTHTYQFVHWNWLKMKVKVTAPSSYCPIIILRCKYGSKETNTDRLFLSFSFATIKRHARNDNGCVNAMCDTICCTFLAHRSCCRHHHACDNVYYWIWEWHHIHRLAEII